MTLAFCWSHLRRQFYEVFVGGNAPIAAEALARIKKLYEIEAEIRGLPPEVRRGLRQQQSKPIVDALKPWLEASLATLSKGSKLGLALRYGLNHWNGLCRFLDDGHIEIDSNTVERSIRGLTLTRKNALFAGHDEGAKSWAMIASLVGTCKLNGVDPQGYLAEVLGKIVAEELAKAVPELTLRIRNDAPGGTLRQAFSKFLAEGRPFGLELAWRVLSDADGAIDAFDDVALELATQGVIALLADAQELHFLAFAREPQGVLAGEPDDALDVGEGPVAVADRGDRDERRVVGQRVGECARGGQQ